jgi:hypothetical protein
MEVMTVPPPLAVRIPACTPESFAGQGACSLNSPSHPLALLPQGEKGGSRVAYATFTVSAGEQASGRVRPATKSVPNGRPQQQLPLDELTAWSERAAIKRPLIKIDDHGGEMFR